MYRINSQKPLTEAIRNMEAQRDLELEILKKHAEYTLYELNPVTIVKEKLRDEIFKNSLLKAGIGLATGFITKKVFVGPKAGLLKHLLGTAVQAAVSGFVINKLPEEEDDKHL
jgi:hypothetical protein